MIGSTLLAVTIVPVLCTWLVRGPFHSEDAISSCACSCASTIRARLGAAPSQHGARRRRARCCVSRWSLAFGLPAAMHRCVGLAPPLQRLTAGMGSEFMPPLNEGRCSSCPCFCPRPRSREVKRIMAWQDRVHRGDAGSRLRRRQTRPRRHRHRSRAGRDDRDHDHAQAAERMARGHDQGKARRRTFARSSRKCPATCPAFSSRSKIASSCLAPASARRSASRFSATISTRCRRKPSRSSAIVRDVPGADRRRALARAGKAVSRRSR